MENKRIFIVEDEGIIANRLQQILNGFNYEIAGAATTGEDALALIPNSNANLVLMDIRLAGKLNGIETARELNKLLDIPIIYLTAYSDEILLERAKETSPYGYLLKPIQDRELRATIEMTLSKHEAGKKLLESEERYKIVSRITSDYAFSISVLPSNEIKLEWTTPGFEENYGFPFEEFLDDRTVGKHIHKDDLHKLDTAKKLLLAGKEANLEIRLIKADGLECWQRVHLYPIFNKNRTRIIKIYGATQNITLRKKAELELYQLNNELELRVQERTAQLENAIDGLQNEIKNRILIEENLKESELRYRSLVSHLPEYILVHHQGRIIYYNQEVLSATGYSEEEMKNVNILNLITPQYHKTVIEMVSRLYAGEVVPDYEIDIQLAGGGVKRTIVRSSKITFDKKEALLIVLIDITQLRNAERLIQRRLDIETMISEISSKFISLSADKIDAEITEALRKIGEFAEADRSYLMQVKDGGKVFKNLLEWCAEGIEPQIENFTNIPLGTTPWLTAKLKNFEAIYISKIDDLPDEADFEKQLLSAGNIKSIIAAPLISKNVLIGFLGFEYLLKEKPYDEGDILLFQLASQLISNALEKKRTEEAMFESEERYRLFINNSTEGIYRMEIAPPLPLYLSDKEKAASFLDNARLAECNNSFAKMYGYKNPYDLVGMKLSDFWVGTREQIIENLAGWFELNSDVSDHETIEKDKFGNLRYFLNNSIRIIENNFIHQVWGTQRDITEKKISEIALSESQERYRLLVEFSPYAIVIHQNGKLVYANNASLKIIGAESLDQIIGRDVMDFVHPDFKKMVTERIIETAKTLKTLPPAEEKLIRLDGKYIDAEIISVPFELNGALAFQLIIRDISDIKAATEQLRKLSRAVEQSPAGILITDTNGNTEYVNPKFTEITGYTFEEVFGRNPRILNPGDKSAEYYKNMWDTLLIGNEWRGEFQNRKKTGQLYWDYNFISPIKNENGEITHFLSIKEDITERKRIEEELIRAKEEAEEANKLKSSLLANMSHEFRTPLNGILGFAQLLKDEIIEPELYEMVEKINRSGKRLMNTLNSVLSLTELENNNYLITKTEVDLPFFCHQLKTLYESFACEKKLEFNLGLKTENLSVVTDENLLTKITSAIVENAIKYTYSGEIRIELETLKQVNGKELALIHVKDTGIGIKKEDHATIFREFKQLSEGFRRDFEGLGLGLTIARRMAHLIGADVLVESEPGKGSKFTITLPLSASTETVDHEKKTAATLRVSKKDSVEEITKLDILLVEDNLLNIEVVERFLSKVGKVSFARDGITAIKMASENLYDLFLIDINLGHGIDGIEVLKKIRLFEQYKNIPIIALTGYASDTNKREFLEQGFTHYLAKPFEKKDLLNIISEIS